MNQRHTPYHIFLFIAVLFLTGTASFGVHAMRAKLIPEAPVQSTPPPIHNGGILLSGSPNASLSATMFLSLDSPFVIEERKELHALLSAPDKDLSLRIRFIEAQTTLGRYAALASLCAHDQGSFQEMTTRILDAVPMADISIFPTIASELNLNRAQFNECLQTERHAPLLLSDAQDAQLLEVEIAPTFYINDRRFTGSFQEFRKTVELVRIESSISTILSR